MTFPHQKKMHMFLCESEPKVESWRVWSRQLEIIRLNLCDSFEKDQTFNCRKYNSSQDPRKVWKSGVASIIWQVKSPPLVEIGLTDLPKSGVCHGTLTPHGDDTPESLFTVLWTSIAAQWHILQTVHYLFDVCLTPWPHYDCLTSQKVVHWHI